jgi:hypothetical protein
LTNENIEYPGETVQDVLASAKHSPSSCSLREFAFPVLEQALAALMADIESKLLLLKSGDYYRNPPEEPLSSLLKAASNIVQELEFRKGCYWTF